MELRVLTYFLAVADLGSVSAAAAHCYVSQPAISRQLTALEQELSVALFDRTAAGLKLNAAGQRLYPIARDLRNRADRGAHVMRTLTTGSLDLVVACPRNTMEYVVSPFVAETAAPIADVREDLPADVYAHLDQHGADLALGTSRPPSSFACTKLMDARISVQYRPPHERFVHGSTIDLTDLEGERLYIAGSGSAIRHAIADAEADYDLRLDYEGVVSSSTMAQCLAATGRGNAIVAEPPRFGLHGSYIAAGNAPLSMKLYAAWDPEHYADAEITALAQQLACWMRQNLGDVLSLQLE